jgi:hypothetical protein
MEPIQCCVLESFRIACVLKSIYTTNQGRQPYRIKVPCKYFFYFPPVCEYRKYFENII